MTYRELLALYRAGALEEEKRREIEADIEKQDAISEYLCEEAEIPGLADLPEEPHAQEGEEARFVSLIQKSIRRAFVRMGITVGAAVLAIVLFAVFALPGIVSFFYYDPTEVVGEGAVSGIPTERMSLDLSVYSELFLPGSYRNQVIAEAEGYGAYTIAIPQVFSRDGRFTTVNGKLVRGRLTLYDTNTLRRPSMNLFVMPEGVKGASCPPGDRNGAAGTQAEAFQLLQGLDEEAWYQGFVSLTEVTDYAAFYRWLQENDLTYGVRWCALYAENEQGEIQTENTGFALNLGGACLDWDRETYPGLCLLDNETIERQDPGDAAAMQTHMISLLSYMRDHREVREIFGDVPFIHYEEAIRGVERDGLRIYGFVIEAQRETLIGLSEDPAVSYIYTTPQN